jgi:hypothetical protein
MDDVDFAADVLIRCLTDDAKAAGLPDGYLVDRLCLVEYLRRAAKHSREKLHPIFKDAIPMGAM